MDAVRQRRAPSPPGAGTRVEGRLHVAVISAGSGVLATLADRSSDGLLLRLRRYVEDHAAVTLWPDSARRVLDLLVAGETDAAIELYFDLTGDRWDREHLHRDVLELD